MPTGTQGAGYSLRVVTYHRIGNPGDTPHLDPALVSATPEVFRKQVQHLRKRYRPVTLEQVQDAFLDGGPLPTRAVLVTFDDAYRDFAELAWPILREFHVPVTVFVPTAYPGQPSRALWWDRLHRAALLGSRQETWRRALRSATAALKDLPDGLERLEDIRGVLRDLPPDETEAFIDRACRELGVDDSGSPPESNILSWDELRRLEGEGVTFGAHTRHHASLCNLSEIGMRAEIQGSLEDLTRELGEGPWPIAYPYGIYDRTVARIAREEGCALGFTCEDGLSEVGVTDPFELRRTNITMRTSPTIFAVRMLPWFAEVDRWRHRDERGRYER